MKDEIISPQKNKSADNPRAEQDPIEVAVMMLSLVGTGSSCQQSDDDSGGVEIVDCGVRRRTYCKDTCDRLLDSDRSRVRPDSQNEPKEVTMRMKNASNPFV